MMGLGKGISGFKNEYFRLVSMLNLGGVFAINKNVQRNLGETSQTSLGDRVSP